MDLSRGKVLNGKMLNLEDYDIIYVQFMLKRPRIPGTTTRKLQKVIQLETLLISQDGIFKKHSSNQQENKKFGTYE